MAITFVDDNAEIKNAVIVRGLVHTFCFARQLLSFIALTCTATSVSVVTAAFDVALVTWIAVEVQAHFIGIRISGMQFVICICAVFLVSVKINFPSDVLLRIANPGGAGIIHNSTGHCRNTVVFSVANIGAGPSEAGIVPACAQIHLHIRAKRTSSIAHNGHACASCTQSLFARLGVILAGGNSAASDGVLRNLIERSALPLFACGRELSAIRIIDFNTATTIASIAINISAFTRVILPHLSAWIDVGVPFTSFLAGRNFLRRIAMI